MNCPEKSCARAQFCESAREMGAHQLCGALRFLLGNCAREHRLSFRFDRDLWPSVATVNKLFGWVQRGFFVLQLFKPRTHQLFPLPAAQQSARSWSIFGSIYYIHCSHQPAQHHPHVAPPPAPTYMYITISA